MGPLYSTTAALNGTSQTDLNTFIMLKGNTRTDKKRGPMGYGGVGEVSMGEPTAEVDPGRARSSCSVRRAVIEISRVSLHL